MIPSEYAEVNADDDRTQLGVHILCDGGHVCLPVVAALGSYWTKAGSAHRAFRSVYIDALVWSIADVLGSGSQVCTLLSTIHSCALITSTIAGVLWGCSTATLAS